MSVYFIILTQYKFSVEVKYEEINYSLTLNFSCCF